MGIYIGTYIISSDTNISTKTIIPIPKWYIFTIKYIISLHIPIL